MKRLKFWAAPALTLALVLGIAVNCAAFQDTSKTAKTALSDSDNEADAAKPKAPKVWSVDVYTESMSQYLGGNGAVFHSGPVQQTSITVSGPKGIYFGTWNSVPFAAQGHPDFGFEQDANAGWNGKVDGFLLNGDVQWIATSPLRHLRGDVLQLSAKIGRSYHIGDRQNIQPWIQAQHVNPVSGTTPRQGLFLRLGVDHSWTAIPGRLALNSNLDISHDSGAFGFNPAMLVRANSSACWNVDRTGHLKMLFPVVKYIAPLTPVSDGRKGTFILGGGASYHW